MTMTMMKTSESELVADRGERRHSQGVLLDLDQTLVLTSRIAHLRDSRRWKDVSRSMGETSLPPGTRQFLEEVRVKRNLSYGADATLLSNQANSAYLSVTTQKPNETLRVMFGQVEFLQTRIIPKEGLHAIVSGFLTKYYTKLETNDAQAARLAEYELLGGGWQRLQMWISEVNKVKPEDINRVSKTYLKNFHFAVAGNPKEFDKDLFLSR